MGYHHRLSSEVWRPKAGAGKIRVMLDRDIVNWLDVCEASVGIFISVLTTIKKEA